MGQQIRLSQLSKAEKIDLIKRIQAGDIPLIMNGQIIGEGILLIEKDGEYYLDGSKIDTAKFQANFTGTSIILPDNGRDKM